MKRKLAKDIVVGDYVNMNIGSTDYPHPSDTELHLCRVDSVCPNKTGEDDGEDCLVFCTLIDVNYKPGCGPDEEKWEPYEMFRARREDRVATWTEEEAEAFYGNKQA